MNTQETNAAVFVAIDPGKDGGIACLHADGSLSLKKIPLIGTEVDLQALKSIIASFTNYPQVIIALEDVKPFPGVSALSMGKLMELKGIKLGLIVGLNIPYVLVAPKAWQAIAWKGVPVQKKSSTGKNDTKATSLLAARRIFPTESFLATERSKVPHDGLVDAALMAFYLKSTYGK
jgi:hypothetical protein